MIPEAAVGAAMIEIEFALQTGEGVEATARAALEAAAPHMLAAAWDDAYAKGRDRGEWEAAPVTEEPRHTNPYRAAP